MVVLPTPPLPATTMTRAGGLKRGGLDGSWLDDKVLLKVLKIRLFLLS